MRDVAGRPWTTVEDLRLTAMFPHFGYAEIAEALGRTRRACYIHAYALGLTAAKGSDAWRLRIARTSAGIRRNRRCEFKKGHVPWNAGRRWRNQPAGCKATQFKKGALRGSAARKWKCVGAITCRLVKGNLCNWIKVKCTGRPRDRWVPVARRVWEQAHGPVPPGMFVVHRDGKTLNDALGNLRCVNRADHLAIQEIRDPSVLLRRAKACRRANERRWRHYRLLRDSGVKKTRRNPGAGVRPLTEACG